MNYSISFPEIPDTKEIIHTIRERLREGMESTDILREGRRQRRRHRLIDPSNPHVKDEGGIFDNSSEFDGISDATSEFTLFDQELVPQVGRKRIYSDANPEAGDQDM